MSPVAGPERQIQPQLVRMPSDLQEKWSRTLRAVGQTGSNQFAFVWWWVLSLASALCLSHQATSPSWISLLQQ